MVDTKNKTTSVFKIVLEIVVICSLRGSNHVHGRCSFTEETCPPGWALWGGNCYKAIDPLPWSNAIDECVRIGGVMTAPGSREEDVYLENLTGGSVNIWINCNDLRSQGTWECKEGDTYISYRNWAAPNPDNYSGNERCVEIWKSSALWNDADCGWDHPSVCKQSVTKIVHWR